MKKTIWMFAGQGCQYYQMARELFEKEQVFRDSLEKGDRLLQPLINESIIDIIYRPRKDRFEPFKRLLYSHPAILLVECAVAQVLLARGFRPDYLLGYSLGECSALVVSEAISLEQALVALIKQAELIEYCAPAGGMIVVLDSADVVNRYPEAFAGCEIAGHNFQRSLIVSGLPGPVAQLQRFLKEKGINWMELPVGFPFHTRWMDTVATPSRAILQSLPIVRPKVPILSAELCGPVQDFSPAHLWNATRNRIDFVRLVRETEAAGPYFYVDLGPSASMSTSVKYNLPPTSQSQFFSLVNPFGQELRNLARLAEMLRA